uniref:NACC family member 2 n=1 Tax=Sphaeramia orbicularis TaxID=375764 RepID=A0A672YNI0_9TELE
MSEGLLQVEIPDFGSSVLGSLNEQRLMGHYCDVSILVQGQAFKAHRAVLAASSLYFRDLFSSAAVFELPSSVTPTCFQQILSFCYTGRLSMAASEQLVLMYTAGYLQIQNIVERGMELMMMKASSSSSPLCCDSQVSPVTPEPPGTARCVTWAPAEVWSLDSQGAPAFPLTPLPLTPPRRRSWRRTTTVTPFMLDCTNTSMDTPETPTVSLTVVGGGRWVMSPPPPHVNQRDMVRSVSVDPLIGHKLWFPCFCSFEDFCLQHKTQFLFPLVQEKLEMLPLPLANERRPCVLVGRDNMALPASLISQIGYRCHPSLYTEGDPGEKVELVVGSGVFMTRGQLMNCHLCAGVKHKVLLRRLLATFFDRNTLANSCGTGIRSSTNDPSRKPLDNRVLNTVKLYCQNFAPNFKESEMNVIAADMCTNARRVRKRWLPKIQSLLPDGLPANTSSTSPHPRKGKRSGVSGGGPGGEAAAGQPGSPFELDLRQLSASYLSLEAPPIYAERREADKEKEKEKEREAPAALLPHLQFAGSRGGGGGTGGGAGGGGGGIQAEEGLMGNEADGGGRLQTEQPPDLPHSLTSSSSSSSSSSHPSPQPAEPAPTHRGLADMDERGAEPLEDSQ